MAEESEGPSAGGREATDPVAISPALDAAAHNGRVAAKAEAFLEKQGLLSDEQRELTRLQARELAFELHLRHWSLRARHISDVLKMSFELALAVIGLAVVAFGLILSASDRAALTKWRSQHG
jgi:hypothetical protein